MVHRSFPHTLNLNFETAIRLLADILMVNTSFMIALGLRYLWLVGIQEVVISAHAMLLIYIQYYVQNFWLLSVISIVIFWCSGFYNFTRLYRGRYKALVVAQAVSLSYLVFGFTDFLFPQFFALPRSVLFLAWGLTLLTLIGARLWSTLWKRFAYIEQRCMQDTSPSCKPRHVLVIGGAGYIGSALLPKLLHKGYRVRLLDLMLFGETPIASVIDHPNLEIIRADFRQVDSVVEAMRDIDAVIHLGAIVGDPACALDEELTIEINLMATRMIAEVARGNNVHRFLFASTCSVYGASDEILDEHSQLNPVSLYARSKIASERVLQRMADERFAPVLLRFGTIYGLSGRTRFDLVVNLLSAKAIVDGTITIFGGDQWRPFVHVDDAALAVFKALEAPLVSVHNQVFNVGSNNQNYTIQQVGELIHRLVPTATLLCQGSDGDRRNYQVNFDKIHNVLGFVPQWTMHHGVQQVIEAIQSGQVTSYQDVRYSNVKFLNEQGTSRMVRRETSWARDMLQEPFDQHEENRALSAQPEQARAVGTT
jgi:nucleoside-diphosphate-sugar epimerase